MSAGRPRARSSVGRATRLELPGRNTIWSGVSYLLPIRLRVRLLPGAPPGRPVATSATGSQFLRSSSSTSAHPAESVTVARFHGVPLAGPILESASPFCDVGASWAWPVPCSAWTIRRQCSERGLSGRSAPRARVRRGRSAGRQSLSQVIPTFTTQDQRERRARRSTGYRYFRCSGPGSVPRNRHSGSQVHPRPVPYDAAGRVRRRAATLLWTRPTTLSGNYGSLQNRQVCRFRCWPTCTIPAQQR
jgi:hypothetical protein